MSESEILKILFFGDITGRPGRLSVKSYLEKVLKSDSKPDFVIANIENASHGFGLTKKNYEDLSNAGIDCMTSGNHIWDKRVVYEYINTAVKLLRPIIYPKGTPGVGSRIFDVKNHKIAVISVLGRVFMPPIDSPWEVVISKIEQLKEIGVTDFFLDFHAEATAEKICFAKYLANTFNTENNALIKGFWGTHTHVQTADENIYKGMAYISDAGFCGSTAGVIGMEFSTSQKRLATSLPDRYEVASDEEVQINGVEVLIDSTKAISINRINLIVNNNEMKKEAVIDTGD